jgi:hypothetical protein
MLGQEVGALASHRPQLRDRTVQILDDPWRVYRLATAAIFALTSWSAVLILQPRTQVR